MKPKASRTLKRLLAALIVSWTAFYDIGCGSPKPVNPTPCVVPRFPNLTIRIHPCKGLGVDVPFNCLTPAETAMLAAWLSGVNEYLVAIDTCPLVVEYNGQ